MTRRMLAILGLAASLVGCSTTNVSDLVKALATDTNSVVIDVAGPFGTVHVSRNGPHQVP